MPDRIRLAALLWALAALAVAVRAARLPATLEAGPPRALTQDASAQDATAYAAAEVVSTSDAATCNATIPACESCRYIKRGGIKTRTVCLSCAAGYLLKNSGFDCWCAPGLYWDQANSTWQCVPCGAGYYCPGARMTQESGAARVPCGAHKTTTTDYARSDRECVVLPGYGWAAGDGSAPCPVGTYNPGFNTRRCAACAGGLTTAAELSQSADACVAPPGSFYMRGRAVACWRGSYSSKLGTDACALCPEGFTTADGGNGMTSPDNCTWVLAGYYAPPGAVLGTTPAVKCPEDTYRGGDAPYDNSTGVACTPCPDLMRTTDVGQTSRDACLAPPSYGYNSTAGAAYLCPLATYNEGWNLKPCAACGAGNITTDAPGARTSDDCVTPPGHQLLVDGGGVYTAKICPAGSFGSPNKTYGLQVLPCIPCLEFTTNHAPGGSDPAACVTLPGYGYFNGGVSICDYGYWSPGGGRSPCSYCGDGFNTTPGAAPGGAPAQGATAAADCAVAQGFYLQPTGGVAACPQGFYKSALGPAACSACPSGTTTSKILGASSLSDCDACRRGYGVAAGGAIDPANPRCSACPSGSWGPGGRGSDGSAECRACPVPESYSGNMTSKPATATPEGCFPEFTTDAARNVSHLSWDFIPMDASALSAAPAATTLAACQAACAAIADCQYYQYSATGAGVAGGPAASCLLRDRVPFSAVNVSDTSKSYVFFEIAEGHYVVYAAHATDAASLGLPLGSYATLADALAACNGAAACVGIKFVHTEVTAPWRTFQGSSWEGATSSARVIGGNVDAWITGDGSA